MPKWLTVGRRWHLLIGAGYAIVTFLLGASLLATVVGALIIGIVHEHDDSVPGDWFSDFKRVNGGPWNGVLDVLAFGTGALMAGILCMIVKVLIH